TVTIMGRVSLLCLLLVTSLGHVTSFAVHRRSSRSTDLAEALRMLERQRRRIDNENYLSFPPQLLGDRPLTLDDLEPWMEEADDRDNAADEVNAAWLAKTLGLDGYGGDEDLSGVLPGNYLQEEPVDAPAPLEEQPSDEELDAIFGEKNEKAADNPESSS
ncbi:hypothetical protein BaRGS_00028301, partial [Batillaria attramentaria]